MSSTGVRVVDETNDDADKSTNENAKGDTAESKGESKEWMMSSVLMASISFCFCDVIQMLKKMQQQNKTQRKHWRRMQRK